MPLLCSMFKTFARSRASGSKWDYTWEQMLADFEADGLFAEWWVAHQAELAGEESDQTGTTEVSAPTVPEAVEETVETPDEEEEVGGDASEKQHAPETLEEGWKKREDAYDWAAYLFQQLVDNGYGDLEVRLHVQGGRYQVMVVDAASQGYRRVCGDDVDRVVAMARNRTFSTAPESSADQTEAIGD